MRPTIAAFLLVLTAACSSTDAARSNGEPRGDGGRAEKADGEDGEGAYELAKLEAELRIATLEAEARIARGEREVADAQVAVAHAERDLANFEVERAIRVADEELGMDRARQSVAEDQMELDELIAMYDADQFATTTKELVVSRSRARLEFSRRGLEIAEREMRQVFEVELPRESEELTLKLDAARFELEMARHDLEVTRLETKLELEEKQRELDEKRTEVGGGA
jgi:hypothetical protein